MAEGRGNGKQAKELDFPSKFCEWLLFPQCPAPGLAQGGCRLTPSWTVTSSAHFPMSSFTASQGTSPSEGGAGEQQGGNLGFLKLALIAQWRTEREWARVESSEAAAPVQTDGQSKQNLNIV
jgi:hypothetical protein